MQEAYRKGVFHPPETYVLTTNNYGAGHEDWFPANPDCPNHKVGVPFSSAYADPNPSGQVSCADCFLHSTIIQSMNLSCQHLHACSNCASCYSHNTEHPQNPVTTGLSPPLLPSNSPPEANVSPPLLHQIPTYESSAVFNHNSPTQLRQQARETPFQKRSIVPQQEKHSFESSVPHPHSTVTSRTRTEGMYPHHDIHHLSRHTPPRNTNSSEDSTQTTLQGIHPQSILQLPKQSQSRDNSSTGFDGAKLLPAQQNSKQTKPETLSNRKRGANDLCEVCGDRASGYHYNALTCEGCKGFFRRSINRKEPLYSCKFGGSCEMDTYTRRKCPECRLKKCKAVGMLEECLLTEIQCRSKRRNRAPRKNKETDVSSSTAKSASGLETIRSQNHNHVEEDNGEINEAGLTHEEEKLINFVSSAFVDYASNPELVKGWTSYLNGKSNTAKLSDLATAHVRVLVEFTKKLPGFSRLNAEDQIGLLKGSVVEIGLLRNSHSYNQKKGEIDLSIMVKDTGLHEAHFRCLLDFFRKVDKLRLDGVEYGLLSSIILFDCDHAYTNDTQRIDRNRDMYISIMKRYSEKRKPKRVQIVAKILNLITELRTLYNTHAQMVSNVRKRGELSALLCEVWDLQ